MNTFAEQRTWGPKVNYPLVKSYVPPKNDFIIIGGPCSVESKEHIYGMAYVVKHAGATHLRGGVFRAGTYPGKNFGYIERDIIEAYHHAAKLHGLKNIIEVLDYEEHLLDMVDANCDVFQVGARSQQNYSLLKKLGSYRKPVFLKRNMGCTVDEWLGSAEHLLRAGVPELHLIERGSSTFHTDVRWTQCLHVIPSVKSICSIPVIVDASHGNGRRDFVEPMTLAGVAAGAGGILVECHNDPLNSLSDAEQAVTVATFAQIVQKTKLIREVL